jgi:hypothetical protein
MPGSDRHEERVERVTEIYVAVFPVPVSDGRMAEAILAGYQKGSTLPNMSLVRATVETHAEAVPDLVKLCDEIVEQQEEINSYRLLKFDNEGIQILSPGDFRTLEHQKSNVQWGLC